MGSLIRDSGSPVGLTTISNLLVLFGRNDMILERSSTGAATRFSRRHWLAASAVMGMAIAARRPIPGAAQTPIATPDGADFSGLVDIGGRSLYLDCRGSGSPTVILVAGAGNNAEIWDTVALPEGTIDVAVLPGVAEFTRVCAYDRPGTLLDFDNRSRSDPAPMPTTAANMVADLHALLDTADVPGPYVLVGHSFGGLVARLYASTYPGEIIGLVLVDSAHEEYYAAVQEVLTPEAWAQYAVPPPELADYPEFEQIDTDTSAIQMQDAAIASPLQPMPLVVLTHGQPWDWPADFPGAALEAVWPPLQEDLASLVPDSRLVVAEESGHYIQLEQPDLVIEAIRQVVEAVRDPDTWATPMATGDDVSGIESGGSRS
jgi:pimeloyl-ACP methyl ester carboxylesterase